MEKLLIYRERLLKFIAARGRYIQSGIRFLSGFILFYAMGRLFGYTDFFASPFFLVMMGIINVFIPTSALSLIFYVVIFLQLAHVSLEVALFFLLAVLLYFLVYQRVFPETRIYLMMVLSIASMHSDLCRNVCRNCRNSCYLNGNIYLLSCNDGLTGGDTASDRSSTWKDIQPGRSKSNR